MKKKTISDRDFKELVLDIVYDAEEFISILDIVRELQRRKIVTSAALPGDPLFRACADRVRCILKEAKMLTRREGGLP